MSIITDTTVNFNRPDIALIDRINSTCHRYSSSLDPLPSQNCGRENYKTRKLGPGNHKYLEA